MARIVKGSHRFTCTPHIYLLAEWTHTCLFLLSQS